MLQRQGSVCGSWSSLGCLIRCHIILDGRLPSKIQIHTQTLVLLLMLQRQHGVCGSSSSLYHSQPIYVHLSCGHPTDHSKWMLQTQCGVCGSLTSPGCFNGFRTTLESRLPIFHVHQTLIQMMHLILIHSLTQMMMTPLLIFLLIPTTMLWTPPICPDISVLLMRMMWSLSIWGVWTFHALTVVLFTGRLKSWPNQEEASCGLVPAACREKWFFPLSKLLLWTCCICTMA